MKQAIVLLALAMGLSACSKSADTPATDIGTASAEYTALLKAQAATQDAATDPNGLINGSGLEISSFVNGFNATASPMMVAWNPETGCETSGWPSSTLSSSDSGYAMKFLLCGVLKRPDGPDTVRGGFDRITGMLCALGDLTYDGVQRTKSMTISTACFSQSFVTTACTFIVGTSSTGPCNTDALVLANSNDGTIAPASFDKYVTMSILDGAVAYTFAHKITATAISGSAMEGLPSVTSTGAAFAFHLDATAGVLRFEGRFSEDNQRHMRINLEGELSTSLEITNVQNLQFVQGENFEDGASNLSGKYISVKGTPQAGRRLKINDTSDLTAGSIVWSPGADDNLCIGETGVVCTSNTGITPTDKKFFFVTGSGYTATKTWFQTNSYLGSVSNTLDMDDIWD